MDKFGVPKKVNRHVLKAVNKLTNKGCNKLNFTSIFDVVEETLKKTLPTPHFRTAVKKSLQNFCNLGVVEQLGTGFYKPLDPLQVLPRKFAPKTEAPETAEEKEQENSLKPIQSKKRVNSDDPTPENDPSRPVKRLRTGKSPSKKSQMARSSKVRIRRAKFIDEMQREEGKQSVEPEDKREKSISVPTPNKRRMKSDESTPENDPSRKVKRRRTGKSPSVKEHTAHFSKARELQDELQLEGGQFFENQGINNSSLVSETRLNIKGFETSVELGLNEICPDSIQTSAENQHTLSSGIQDPQPESSGSSVLFQSTKLLISSERKTQSQLEIQNEPEPTSKQDDKDKDEQNQDNKGEDEERRRKEHKSRKNEGNSEKQTKKTPR